MAARVDVERMTMGSTVGMGVVGAGAIGMRGALTHLTLEDVSDRVHVAAVCDPIPGRAKAASEKFRVPSSYETFEELLADDSVDAVTICSPIGLHYEQGMQAIEAAKHVHFNKTMTTTVQEANDIIEAAARRGVRIVASPGMLLYPHNRRIRKAVLDGEIGKPYWAVAGTAGVGDYHMNEEFRTGEDILTDVDPSWYYRKPGGGPQYDVTVYCLHILTGILGPARRLTAFSGMLIPERNYHGKKIACDIDDTTMMLLDFGDSLFAVVYAAVKGSLTRAFQPTIFGATGSVVGTMVGDRETMIGRSPHVTGPHADLPEAHVFEDIMQLVDVVHDGGSTVATPEHARHVIDIIESGYRSAETGRAEDLITTFVPPTSEELG